ncbi:transcriptional regulator [Propioniciclava sp. MC1595]|uniref:winged helix-turn-helix domain-containing protein n=1 Tax=unclassified Propioniciclava TaxID=2642922 RepID=UPI00160011EA|nr:MULTISPECIES: transcriptional regulator [unclassified Propioniciclava]MBB1495028.1 transcriptional regulator [Propioniciclava sp. MC1595]MBB1502131.1 transcriptional regulator [Propioniciclava sp. MC1683]QTE25641.1 transcriptional regulator [Propioniciclava sp. MC1595]
MTAPETEHPRHQLNDQLTHPVRFSLAAALAATDEIDFASVRDHLQVSDSVLSRQASQLEELGLVHIKKGYVGKRPRTWLSLTGQGRAAWASHLDALRAIAGQA